jgi:hypothetical protein
MRKLNDLSLTATSPWRLCTAELSEFVLGCPAGHSAIPWDASSGPIVHVYSTSANARHGCQFPTTPLSTVVMPLHVRTCAIMDLLLPMIRPSSLDCARPLAISSRPCQRRPDTKRNRFGAEPSGHRRRLRCRRGSPHGQIGAIRNNYTLFSCII